MEFGDVVEDFLRASRSLDVRMIIKNIKERTLAKATPFLQLYKTVKMFCSILMKFLRYCNVIGLVVIEDGRQMSDHVFPWNRTLRIS